LSDKLNKTLARGKELLAGFTPGQRGVIVVVTLALVLGAFALTRWVSTPTWTPLYGSLEGADASAIVEELNASGVKYQLEDGGSTVMVPQSQVYDVRVALSGKGLPAGGSETDGYSLLDKQGITATDFQQNVAYRRALEGELAKTLQAIDGVKTAVVHLALPKKDVFASEQDKTTASVLLAVKTGKTLDRAEVESVTHLVAGSVEGLDPADVTVTDASGKLLSSPDDGTGVSSAAAVEADEHTAAYEQRTVAKVQDMLDEVLGAGHAVVRVNATLNYDDTERTSEKYTQPSPTAAPLSESRETEKYNGAGSGAGAALGQTFPTPAAGGAAGGGGAYEKDKRTVNNSVDKVVEHTNTAPGTVERLTVAVVLDSGTATSVDNAQIESLVANAAGIDTERGDAVQVDRVAFDTSAAAAAKAELAKAESAAQRSEYLSIGKQAGFALLVILILLIAWRRRRRTTVDATASDLPDYPADALMLSGLGQQAIEGPVTPSTDIPALPSSDELGLARQRMRDQVAELVDNQPDDVARVIQGWLAERS
jgi:flagellar M-ring protein FliF